MESSGDVESELVFLRRMVYRLNAALSKHQGNDSLALDDESKHDVLAGDGLNPPQWLTSPALLSPLIVSYEEHMASIVAEVAAIKTQNEEYCTKLKDVVNENQRLHSELEEVLQQQLQTFESTENATSHDDATLRNLQTQLDLAHKEKSAAVDMNKETMQLLDKIRHERVSEVSRAHANERIFQETKARNEKLEDANLRMQITIEQLQNDNQSLSCAAKEQLDELRSYQNQLREYKQKVRDATSKEEEAQRTLGNLKINLQNLRQDNVSVEHNYQSSLNTIQQLESSTADLESRHAQLLDICSEKNSELERIRVQISALEKINAEVDSKEMSYLMQMRESAQLLDDALLARDSAVMREKQCRQDLENSKIAMETLVDEIATRVTSEVDKVKLTSSLNLRKLMDEVESLELDVANARSEAGRAKRAKQVVEDEFEVLSKKHKEKTEDNRVEELQRRTLNAERARDDAIITIQSLEDTLKRSKLSHGDEMTRLTTSNTNLEQLVRRLRRGEEESQHSRLSLIETLNQCRHDIQNLEERARSAKLEASKEFSLKQETIERERTQLESRLRSVESSSRDSSRQLHKMLADQQRMTARWREEGKSSCEAYEEKIKALKEELNHMKRRCQHLGNKIKLGKENEMPETMAPTTMPAVQMSATEQNHRGTAVPELEESNRRLKAQLHETQYKLLSATQKLGNFQSLHNSLTMNDLS